MLRVEFDGADLAGADVAWATIDLTIYGRHLDVLRRSRTSTRSSSSGRNPRARSMEIASAR
jgi:hypothetical protein